MRGPKGCKVIGLSVSNNTKEARRGTKKCLDSVKLSLHCTKGEVPVAPGDNRRDVYYSFVPAPIPRFLYCFFKV